jgi:hypothetical protein
MGRVSGPIGIPALKGREEVKRRNDSVRVRRYQAALSRCGPGLVTTL